MTYGTPAWVRIWSVPPDDDPDLIAFRASARGRRRREIVLSRMMGLKSKQIAVIQKIGTMRVAAQLRECGQEIPVKYLGKGGCFCLSSRYAEYLGITPEQLAATGAADHGDVWYSVRPPGEEERDERRRARWQRRWRKRRR